MSSNEDIKELPDTNDLNLNYYNISDEDFNFLENSKLTITIRKDSIFLRYLPGKINKKYSLDDLRLLITSKSLKINESNEEMLRLLNEALNKPIKGIQLSNLSFLEQSSENNNMKITLNIDESKIKAFIILSSPILSGKILEMDEIYNFLKVKGIKYINFNTIKKAIIFEMYSIPILIAEGKAPKLGRQAIINFNFDAYKEKGLITNEKDKVNYKNLNIIENVEKDQILAIKYPAKKGEDGYDIFGNILTGEYGQDLPLNAGKNTLLSSDGYEVKSLVKGYPVFKDGSIFVETIYQIQGNVDFKTGNIVFLGPVIISGNILDGFSVRAESVEVKGNVHNALVESDTDIIVKGGIIGKRTYKIKANRNVYAKFIENSIVYANQDVIVKENIMNSFILAGARVICYGKKGSVIGGKVYASKHINTRFLGNPAFTTTYLEVGIDPYFKLKLEEFYVEQTKLEAEITDIDQKIAFFEKRKNLLDEQKTKLLEKYKILKNDLYNQQLSLVEDTKKIEAYLSKLNIGGKISSKMDTYPGVELVINNAKLNIKIKATKKTFYEEDNVIKLKDYEAIPLGK